MPYCPLLAKCPSLPHSSAILLHLEAGEGWEGACTSNSYSRCLLFIREGWTVITEGSSTHPRPSGKPMSLHSCQQDLFWYKTYSDACLLSAGISRPPATCSALCWARQGPRKCESLVPQRLTTRLTKDIMTFPQRSVSSHGAGPGCVCWRLED